MPDVPRKKYKDKSNIQSVLVARVFTLPEAREILKKKGFHDRGHDTTPNWYRFRQFNPSNKKKYYSKKNNSGTIYIIEY